MEYSKLSDFEINLKVAHIILGSGNYDWSPEKKEVYLAGIDGGVFLPNGYFDPCNNPSDAWPIMTENKISVMWMTAEKQWCAWANGNLEEGCWEWSYCPDEYHHDDNPLRAAMIVFLMMQESQHA
ncbi:phage protein NinX family protein [Cronobacter dublinensis]|uniref:phage protein NinX family protein n=1 Tax=Cronobacter dublinensis TaxID=413497 RepID=UPI000CFC6D4D|nr:phage protein NinX family protein [Cronobacter dublinensis]